MYQLKKARSNLELNTELDMVLGSLLVSSDKLINILVNFRIRILMK